MQPPTARPGDVLVPRAERARFAHPLRGTATARRVRQALRWVGATVHARRHNARLPAHALTLGFYPQRPQPKASILRIVDRLGLRIGFDPAAPGVVPFAWDSGHSFSAAAARRLPADAINRRCLDVSKSHVDATWLHVAGYGVAVDPLTTEGPIVVKSELNGTHDGRVLMGPLPRREPGHVYQRLIDGRRDGRVYATRALIIGRRIPLAFEKWRPYPNWFHGGSTVEPAAPEQLWSALEIELILRFTDAIAMDYGEIDVLRETATERIYVVDANRTPIRPVGLDERHDDDVYRVMSDAFADFLAARSAA